MTWRLSQAQLKRIIDYLALAPPGKADDLEDLLHSVYSNMQVTDQEFVYIKGRQ